VGRGSRGGAKAGEELRGGAALEESRGRGHGESNCPTRGGRRSGMRRALGCLALGIRVGGILQKKSD
jgi:hypothetical protein